MMARSFVAKELIRFQIEFLVDGSRPLMNESTVLDSRDTEKYYLRVERARKHTSGRLIKKQH